MSKKVALLSIWVQLVAFSAIADTIHVNDLLGDDSYSGKCELPDGNCGPKQTIRAGIELAQPGDEVVIADGTYRGDGNYNLKYNGKAITVRSANGPDTCFIDCEQHEHAFVFDDSGEGPDSVIQGLTLDNASTSLVYFYKASATIVDCAFNTRVHYARYDGGGIHANRSDLRVRNCLFRGAPLEDVPGSSPGCVDLVIGSLQLEGCTFEDTYGVRARTASISLLDVRFEAGRGASLSDCLGIVYRCSFRDALYTTLAAQSDCRFIDCHFVRNRGKRGGALFVYGNSRLRAERCQFDQNAAVEGGAAFVSEGSSADWLNCTFVGNSAMQFGGALRLEQSSSNVANCTLLANRALDSGGAISLGDSRDVTLTNSILWGNQAPRGSQVALQKTHDGSTISVAYSDVEDGAGGVFVDDDSALHWGDGNFDVDPRLAFEHDFHLIAGSPCIDSGTDAPPGGLTETDIDGGPRQRDGDGDAMARVDIGAAEFDAERPVLSVSDRIPIVAALAGQSGAVELTLAIRNAGAGTLKWRAHTASEWLTVEPSNGSSNGEINSLTIRLDPSGMPQGETACNVQFTADGAPNSPLVLPVLARTNAELRVPTSYGTMQEALHDAVPGDIVLLADGHYSGDGNRLLSFRRDGTALRSEHGPTNCVLDSGGLSHVIEVEFCPANAVTIEGLQFRGAQEAILVDGSAAQIRNCIFRDNRAGNLGCGAGVWTKYSSATIIENCDFIENEAEGGAGVFGDIDTSLEMRDCVLRGNRAKRYGGGVYFVGRSCVIERCLIVENSAERGGGVYATGAIIRDCVIDDNAALLEGAGVNAPWGELLIARTSLRRNSLTAGQGAGVSGSELIATSCIFDSNKVDAGGGRGGGVYATSASRFTSCLFLANSAGTFGGGALVQHETRFSNCTFVANSAGSRGGALSLLDAPTSLESCVLWENQAPSGSQINMSGNKTALSVAFSDLMGGRDGIRLGSGTVLNWLEGNMDADPLFINADDDDFRLSSSSPCIDAGDPDFVSPPGDTDLDGLLRTWDGNADGGAVADMGAYEFGSFAYGDLNCDASIDFNDIDPFVTALLGRDDYESHYPDCEYDLADINRDGSVDFNDIDGFVGCLVNGGCE